MPEDLINVTNTNWRIRFITKRIKKIDYVGMRNRMWRKKVFKTLEEAKNKPNAHDF